MKSSFQAGVDSIYNALVAAGATPDSKDPADIVSSINSGMGSNNFSCLLYQSGYFTTYPGGQGNYDVAISTSGCLVVHIQFGALSEGRLGGSYNGMPITVKLNGNAQSVKYDRCLDLVRNPDGNDNENWSQRDAYFLFKVSDGDNVNIWFQVGWYVITITGVFLIN